jgi:WD40 repeat protein
MLRQLKHILVVVYIGCSMDISAQCYELMDVRECKSGIESMVITPDGKYLVTGHLDGTITSWDLHTLSVINSVNYHTGQVNCLSFNKDGSQLISAANDNYIATWQVPSLTMWRIYDTPIEALSFAAFSSDNSEIYYGGNNTILSNDYNYGFERLPYGVLMKIGAKSKVNEVVYNYEGNGFNITDGAVNYSNDHLYFTKEHDLFICNLADKKIERISTEYFINNLTALNNAVYLWGDGILLKLENINGKFKPREVPAMIGVDKNAYSRIAVGPYMDLAVTGDSGNEVIIWNSNDLTTYQVLFGHSSRTRTFQFCNNDSILLTGGYDGRILVWKWRPQPFICDQINPSNIIFTSKNTPLKIREKKIMQKNCALPTGEYEVSFTSDVKDSIELFYNRKCLYNGVGTEIISLKINIDTDGKENNLVFYCNSRFDDRIGKLNVTISEGEKKHKFTLHCYTSETESIKFIKP